MEKNVVIGIAMSLVIAAIVSTVVSSALIGGPGAAAEKKATDALGRASAAEGAVAKLAPPPRERVFTVSGVELKGSTSTDSLSVPSLDPSKLSAGYRYKGPGTADKADPKKWEVSSYLWEAGPVVAYQGDTVKLVTFILNGDKHVTHIEGPDGTKVVDTQTLERGREYTLTFKAEKAGLYTVICTTHGPTMSLPILVLPRP